MIKDFLEEEYRDGFLVDEKRKKLWKIELDIIEKFKQVCKKYNLSYFLIGGAAIGAVRHKGFIPWDDDLDIGMLREDYDKFLEVAQYEFKDEYFVQTPLTDKGYFCGGIIRIRDYKSTGIVREDYKKNVNNGIFIEVYPFDRTPDNKLLRKIHIKKMSLYYYILSDYCHNNIPQKWYKKIIYRVTHKVVKCIDFNKMYMKYQNISKKYSNKNTLFVDTPSLPYFAKQGIHHYLYDDVKKTIEVPYEYTNLSIASNNHACLTIHFGDYMKLPPISERGMHHNNLVFYDPDKPYTEYMSVDLNNYFGIL